MMSPLYWVWFLSAKPATSTPIELQALVEVVPCPSLAHAHMQEMVEAEFRSVYPGDAVSSVEIVSDVGVLLPFVEEYNKLKLGLEDYLDEVSFQLSQGLKVKRKKVWGSWGREGGILARGDFSPQGGDFGRVDSLHLGHKPEGQ